MKKIWILSIIALIGIKSYTQTPSDCTIPSILISEYETDVKGLAIERIVSLGCSDTNQINIPSAYQDTILHGLSAIFNVSSIFECDSIFDIYCIHNHPSNIPIYNDIMVKINDTCSWTSAWANNNIVTGYMELDNLMSSYGFSLTTYWSSSKIAILHTDQIINMYALVDSLELLDCIVYVDPSVYYGDGNRIDYDKIGDEQFYDFSVGYGFDCNSGCPNRYTWQFKVNYSSCSVEYLGASIYGGSEPFPNPVNCNISVDIKYNDKPQNSIKIYPNPSSEIIKIEAESINSIEIISMTGKMIKSIKRVKEIDISNIPNGIYFLKITSDKETLVRKMIKQ